VSVSIYNKYAPDHKFPGLKVLNVGSGFAKFDSPNVCNIDAFDNCEPDVQWDLNKTPLPFADNTFDLILANHIMEHLQNFWECFEELARIVKPNGRIEIFVPGSGSDAVMGFRDHVREINGCTLFGIHGTYRGRGNAWSELHAVSPANRLKLVKHVTCLENYWWLNVWPLRNYTRAFAAKHLRNVIKEQGYYLRKLTDEEWEIEQRINRAADQNSGLLFLRKPAVSE
jgi:SAM-dependent methyltransferase